MTKACPVTTPAQRHYGAIQNKIEQAMLREVHAALDRAAAEARTEMEAAGLDLPPPSADYFTAALHQNLYCTLCKADPETFAGGKAEIALAIIRNSQNIARHHWGADTDPYPQPARPRQGPDRPTP